MTGSFTYSRLSAYSMIVLTDWVDSYNSSNSKEFLELSKDVADEIQNPATAV